MDVISQLSTHSTLLTPNRRLSAALLKKHHAFHVGKNNTCWDTPDILPFASWIERLWHDHSLQKIQAIPILLSHHQELILWEEIIRHSPVSDALLQVSSTAELAKSAWDIIKQWQIDLNHSSFHSSEDTSTFQKWAAEFQEKCHKYQWIDASSLIEHVCKAIHAKEIVLPREIFLVGFTEFSPLQKQILHLCEKQGSSIHHIETFKQNQTVQRVALVDEENEMITMARWAKKRFDESPTHRIACVVPNLEDKREAILRIFSNAFREPHQLSFNITELPFNISAGKSLISYPIIHAAFQILNLFADSVGASHFSSLLRSPFLGEAEQERMKRAMFETRIHHANCLTLSIDQLLNATQEKLSLSTYCPALAKRLKKFIETARAAEDKQPISHWVSLFIDLLKIMGWPGERSLNSVEYQTVHHCWLPLLTQFTTCDSILGAQNYSTTVHYLTQMAANTVFQPQSPETNVQILGMLEAVELDFDYLWIMGLDDTAWPSSAKPNPFIPAVLQKTLNTPNATPERELVYCKKLTDQLKQSAQHVIFSHAEQNENSELRPSALIKTVPEISLFQLNLSDFMSPTEYVFTTRSTVLFHDEKAPPVLTAESIRGGASIFKLQAACPFKAFAEIRLHAAKLDTPTLGLRPQERGNIVHKALDLIWQALENSDTLKNKTTDELKAIIHDSAQKAIQLIQQEHSVQTRYLSLELQRLEKMLWEWLMFEKTRPYFKVVLREQERAATFGKLTVKLRVDRIDELEQGEKLIIDYKTGKHNHIKFWFDERPEEPQLPLYCVTDIIHTVAISYAEIHPDTMILKGVSKQELNIAGIQPLHDIKYQHAETWESQIQYWKATLEKLSEDFCEGNAAVHPKNKIETCRYCNLKSLCRIHEVSIIDE